MTLKVEGDPGYGSASARGRFTDLDGSETVPLLIPETHHQQYVWKPLNKEELEKCAGGPEWKRFRSRLVLCFWIGWLIMLGTAVAIIIQSPRMASPSLQWWQKDVFYRLQPALFMDADSEEVSRISSVRVMLDLCELDLFEQELGNDTEVWSGASDYIQFSLRYWLEYGVSGFGICDTDAAFSAKTLLEWNVLMQEFSSQDDERILMVRQTSNTLPALKVSNITVNGSLVELVTKSLIPPSLHLLSAAEVAGAMEASLQMPQGHWPSWTVGGGVPWELQRAILVLIMTLPGTPVIKYGDEVSPIQKQLNQPLALFQSLIQSRAREEALHCGRFTFLPFNGSMSSSGLNSTDIPPLAYLRSWGCVHFLVLFNLGSEPHTLDPDWAPSLPGDGMFVISTGLDRSGHVSLRSIKMQPHEAIVIKLFESDNSS
ncbi:amino acid transporter heavy chain SLC3A2 isoform X3 [Pseudorasbora parva]|uniref:amino acid transporter heavy chain SLC3A2 isoform X3 n=1 Tax=Pseudorasbora parva TaxID=51549 RepID=UPI00351F0430